jgi:hypothetical protein
MNPETLAQLAALAAAGVRIVPAPQITTHFILERDGCVVLVERRGESFGAVGSPGLLIEEAGGFAALVDRDGVPWFVGKTAARPATPEESTAARRLFADARRIFPC